MSFLSTLVFAVGALMELSLSGCIGALDEPSGSGEQHTFSSTTFDLADYMIPSCASAGPAWSMSNGEQFQVWPASSSDGRGHFFVVKSCNDGASFEEWSVDSQFMRLYRDTTWGFAGKGVWQGQWCDVQCRKDNYAACAKRWLGDQADYAFTVYRGPAGGPGGPMYRRYVHDGEVFPTSYSISAARRSSCGPCEANFTGSSGHTIRVTWHASWRGFADVLELHAIAGAGAGESYLYARGKGWIGFRGIGGGENHAVQQSSSGPAPVDFCGTFSAGSICNHTGGAASGSTSPSPPSAPSSPSTPQSPQAGCPCRTDVDNYCLYGAKTSGCPMTFPGGYCDPNSDGSFADADWTRGYNEFTGSCS